MKFIELREDLQKLVLLSEEYAIKHLEQEDTFFPYIFVEENKIQRLLIEDLDVAIEEGHDIISDLDIDTGVLVYQDLISFSDGDVEAIVVEIHDMEEDNGYSFALGFKREGGKLLFLNEHVFIGNIRNCLIF